MIYDERSCQSTPARHIKAFIGFITMSNATVPWLDRLLKVTDYRALREVFAAMQREAAATTDSTALIARIDEAVRRIDYELKRDESELQSRRQAYDAFLAEQRGCLGWLRRMWPWSQTSRIERQHQAHVAEQRGEILANQLIVARARMLQERLRPAQERSIGPPRAEWQTQLTNLRDRNDLPRGAKFARELVTEIGSAQSFLVEIEQRIEPFAKTTLTNAEHRQWRNADVAEARAELQALRAEVQSKEALAVEAATRIGQLVQDDLQTRHPAYRELLQTSSRLELQLVEGQSLRGVIQELREQLTRYCSAAQTMAQAPQRRNELQRQLNDCASQGHTRQALVQQLQRDLNSFQERLQRAERDAAQVEGAMRTAEKMFQAYLAEHRIVETPPPGDKIYSSPVALEHQRLQREWQQAQEQRQQAQREFHEAQQRTQRATGEAQSLQQQVNRLQQDLAELEQQQQGAQQDADAWRRALPSVRGRLEERWSAWSRLDSGASSPIGTAFLAISGRLQRWSSLAGGFSAPAGADDSRAAQESLADVSRLVQSLEETLAERQRQVEQLRDQSQRLRRERLTELLGTEFVERMKSALDIS